MHPKFCAQVLQSAVVFDQLNVSELACMLLVCRNLRMSDHRHRILSGSGIDELQEDFHLYMGTGETRGTLMNAPAPRGGGKESLTASSLQMIDKQANFFRSDQSATNDKDSGRQDVKSSSWHLVHHPTVAQRHTQSSGVDSRCTLIPGSQCLELVERARLGRREVDFRSGAWSSQRQGPPCSVAPARHELRLARAGYDLLPAKAVLCTAGYVAVPCDAVKAKRHVGALAGSHVGWS